MAQKKIGLLDHSRRKNFIEPDGGLSVRRQCELADVSRSSHYYMPLGESALNLEYMRLIDEQFLLTPFYGAPRMTQVLRQMGHPVNKKRIERLMARMGLQAVRPKPNLSRRAEGHKIYPYLLRGLKVERPNQVWATDITYIRMQKGFLYLCAVMDWHSRFVLSWRLSNSLDTGFCADALEDALGLGFCPEIFNSDQGRQFTSSQFTGILLDHGVKISMDGRGRALDNVFVERLWRSVKYEHVFLHEYENGGDLWNGLHRYWRFYNEERPHQGLGYKTPKEVFQQKSPCFDPVPRI